MKRTHNIVEESDDDMDDLPLKYISSHKKFISMKELRRYSVHMCEFCDETFENRYDHLIHNAKHIIIPLIKMLPYSCNYCGLYCISEEEMNDHMLITHNINITTNRPKNKDTNKGSDEDEKPLAGMVKRVEDLVKNRGTENVLRNFFMNCKVDVEKFVPQFCESDKNYHKSNNASETLKIDMVQEVGFKPFIEANSQSIGGGDNMKIKVQNETRKKEKHLLENFVMNCKVDVEKFVPPLICESDEIYHKSNTFDMYKVEFKNEVPNFKPLTESNNKSKAYGANLKENNIIKIETTEENNCIDKNYADHLKSPANDCVGSSDFSDIDEDPIMILSPGKIDALNEYASEHNSIHFDDLIKPGIFYCKRCYKRFPTRYEVIIHEVTHLDLSKAAPEGYKSKRKKHTVSSKAIKKTASEQSESLKICEGRQEDVSDQDKRGQKCMGSFCSSCDKGFTTRASKMAHEEKCKGKADVNLCDTCLYLRNRPKHVQYLSIVRLSKEVKKTCHWCGIQCEDMSLVTIISRQRISDRIKFEGDAGVVCMEPSVKELDKKFKKQSISERCAVRGTKVLSNRERLKLIQHRLKKMKK